MPERAAPNVLVLMTDQLRSDWLGCYGHPTIRTPGIDGLARRSVRFTNAFCPTPICVASRRSFITGCRSGQHRTPGNRTLPGPDPQLPTLMTLLKRAGYATQAVGKMHFHGRLFGLHAHQRMEEGVKHRVDDDYLLYLKSHGIRTRYPHGIRDLLYYQPQTSGLPEPHSPSQWVADRSCDYLRQHHEQRPGQPFFLWSSWVAPHPPFAPCAPYDQMYDPDAMDDPIDPARPLETLGPGARASRARMCGAHIDRPRIRRIRALYAGQVTQVDTCVTQVLDELERLGLGQNTIVLFLSDHGEMLGDLGLGQKSVPYSASVRIPMILHWPGQTQPGSTCDALTGIEDFFPTLVDRIGLDHNLQQDPRPGLNMLNLTKGSVDRDHYVIDFGSGNKRWLSVRTSTHVYNLWAQGQYEELYDMEHDPHERHNLASTQPHRLAAMREIALQWEAEHGLGQINATPNDFDTPHATPQTLGQEQAIESTVILNEGPWPDNLPEAERDTVETYAEAFDRAIRFETTIDPVKLPIKQYQAKGGHTLEGTRWKQAGERVV